MMEDFSKILRILNDEILCILCSLFEDTLENADS